MEVVLVASSTKYELVASRLWRRLHDALVLVIYKTNVDSHRGSSYPVSVKPHRKSPEFAPLLVVFFLLVPVLGAPLAAVSPFTPAIAYFHRRSVRRAWSLLTFYATNFIAHAFSVPLTVEVESPHQHQRIFSPIPWAACISIFLPFHGLGRDILLIAQQWDLDSLRTAAVHGALVVVARNKKWRPQEDEEDEVFVKLPEEFDGCSHQAKDNPPAEFQLTEERHILVPEKKQHTVLGELKPPAGYSLVIPTDRAIIEQIMDSAIISTKGIKVHSPPNILKILAAIFQIVSASLVLAFTLGDQVSRFGYAAYGLSVVPYALMSGANVICCAVVGEYNTRHVLRTPILEEAAKRKLAIFDGAVGRLGESEDVRKSKDEAQNSPKDFTPVHLRLTKSEEQVVLAVRKGEIVKNFFLIPEKTDATTSQDYGTSGLRLWSLMALIRGARKVVVGKVIILWDWWQLVLERGLYSPASSTQGEVQRKTHVARSRAKGMLCQYKQDHRASVAPVMRDKIGLPKQAHSREREGNRKEERQNTNKGGQGWIEILGYVSEEGGIADAARRKDDVGGDERARCLKRGKLLAQTLGLASPGCARDQLAQSTNSRCMSI
ncbi:predicted protein [Postia placenta Mad-698-R]|uniref:Uncharacterized protein n=1 Tax=Postia placenta MAD-698-R-SB12 TaxID=670580 RepID=A0A1X6MY28_9APHY|nr:hypothetical protein POSPLADRAFT_1147064 [Postia placenta MAD-698-R-SB12]EED80717.1 predicted protein [Postia placenta Mad-698-R]OSX61275.1 hypothetical protein POSPLADRAFT_1147064 [Postia placenta MAD-698-R-SB12]